MRCFFGMGLAVAVRRASICNSCLKRGMCVLLQAGAGAARAGAAGRRDRGRCVDAAGRVRGAAVPSQPAAAAAHAGVLPGVSCPPSFEMALN